MKRLVVFLCFISIFSYSKEKPLFDTSKKDKVIDIGEITSEYGEILSIIKKDNKLYLETTEGLVLIKDKKKKPPQDTLFEPSGSQILEAKNDDCPTIGEVQQMAIRYANVSPSLIKNWMKRAKYKALLPQFKITYDKSVDYDAGSDKHFIGPNDWEFSITWDFKSLLYTDDMEGIDTRSRLMTGLRNEIIQDVTRLYFERKRLIAENASYLKIEEKTALIDGYTGGWFSKKLK